MGLEAGPQPNGATVRQPRRLALLAGIAAFGLLGQACVSLDVSASYTPPQEPGRSTSVHLDAPFDATWDKLVRRLSQSFFEVGQVSKDSRLINLVAREDQVDGMIDCGTLSYVVNDHPWSFPAAESSQLAHESYFKSLDVVHRASGRIGRMNIFVAPEDQGTRLEVNAVFEVHMTQSGQAVSNNLLGQPNSWKRWGKVSASFRFTTQQPDTELLGGRSVTCRSTEAWESQIIDMAR